ncbi:MAG TPA: LytTR family DNA-binding domain-containing protein, partial [Chitinophagaceae bacterium]|nr:LytTR family DNA-binding domain-containing protein [Chitinophagaceae bacterium]
MLNAIIIEDERPARDLLIQTLTEIDSHVQIDALLSSVTESIEYLAGNPKADIIFSDVQLSDGLSFEIFKHSDIRIPVIFITGYDEFMLNAFTHNGIDYLLKPVNKHELEKSIFKYRMLENHFTWHNEPVKNLIGQIDNRKKTRLVVRRGLEHIALRLEDIVLFYTENKLVYVIDKQGKKYLGDKNLTDMEEELDNTVFFRANRQYIVNINFIRGFKTFEKVK